jgi:hypothetical protein
MLPNSEEVARSMRGSWLLMDEGERALGEFDLSFSGLTKSFAAILLTVPAFVAALFATRIHAGLPRDSSLLEAPGLALQVLAQHAAPFIVVPALVLALMWRVARSGRGTAFVITWNWTEVCVALLLAAPAALLAAGWIDGRMAFAVTIAFAFIAARLRYAVARSALGAPVWSALLIVGLAFTVEIGAAWTFALAVG